MDANGDYVTKLSTIFFFGDEEYKTPNTCLSQANKHANNKWKEKEITEMGPKEGQT